MWNRALDGDGRHVGAHTGIAQIVSIIILQLQDNFIVQTFWFFFFFGRPNEMSIDAISHKECAFVAFTVNFNFIGSRVFIACIGYST